MSEIKTNKISPRKGTTQTIGDSGDTITIASGATLSNAGTISGIQKIDWDTTKKTTAFTAVNQTGYFVDTTSAAITVTFPASPSAGNVIGLKDYANTFDTNNLTINPNGNKIQGSTNNFIVSTEGSALQFIYVDATRGWVLTDASKASDIAEAATFVTATGGCITTCGNYKIHTFTGPGTFCVSSLGNGPTNPLGGPNNVDYLVVAGGGGAAKCGGGGGGGGFRESSGTSSGCYSVSPLGACVSALPVSVTAYPITVGAGGSGGPIGPTEPEGRGTPGSNSVFSTITSAGGATGVQPGGCFSAPTYAGGSGGGGNRDTNTGGAGSGNTPPVSPPQGNPGGDGVFSPSFFRVSGGGGGATEAGVAGTAGGPCQSAGPGGRGGAGATTSISASATAYAGGGGGAVSLTNTPNQGAGSPCGTGGAAGQPGVSGTINRGGAGGSVFDAPNNSLPASCLSAGSGGSGIVIIRYKYQ